MTDRVEHFRNLDRPHRRGDAAEAIVRSAFAVRGVTVCRPEHDNAPYDFVIDVDGRFYRIQCKTAYEARTDGAVRFETRSTRVKRDGYEREGYEGKIDYFSVYDPINDAVYLVALEEATPSSMILRYEEPANDNWSNVNWCPEFAIDEVLSDL